MEPPQQPRRAMDASPSIGRAFTTGGGAQLSPALFRENDRLTEKEKEKEKDREKSWKEARSSAKRGDFLLHGARQAGHMAGIASSHDSSYVGSRVTEGLDIATPASRQISTGATLANSATTSSSDEVQTRTRPRSLSAGSSSASPNDHSFLKTYAREREKEKEMENEKEKKGMEESERKRLSDHDRAIAALEMMPEAKPAEHSEKEIEGPQLQLAGQSVSTVDVALRPEIRSLDTGNSLVLLGRLALEMKNPLAGVPVHEQKIRFKTYKMCFSRSRLVEWLMHRLGASASVADAVDIMLKLFNKGVFIQLTAHMQDGDNVLCAFKKHIPLGLLIPLRGRKFGDDYSGWAEAEQVNIEEKPIAEGGDAVLFKGEWEGELVAVKQVKQSDDILALEAGKPPMFYSTSSRSKSKRKRKPKHMPSALGSDASEIFEAWEDFATEAYMLSGLEHPNIVKLKAVCRDPLALLLEWVPNGSLYSYLHQDTNPLPWTQVLKIATDIAAAVHYLHLNHIIHRDIKSPNVLLVITECGQVTAKLADFGSAEFERHTTGNSKPPKKSVPQFENALPLTVKMSPNGRVKRKSPSLTKIADALTTADKQASPSVESFLPVTPDNRGWASSTTGEDDQGISAIMLELRLLKEASEQRDREILERLDRVERVVTGGPQQSIFRSQPALLRRSTGSQPALQEELEERMIAEAGLRSPIEGSRSWVLRRMTMETSLHDVAARYRRSKELDVETSYAQLQTEYMNQEGKLIAYQNQQEADSRTIAAQQQRIEEMVVELQRRQALIADLQKTNEEKDAEIAMLRKQLEKATTKFNSPQEASPQPISTPHADSTITASFSEKPPRRRTQENDMSRQQTARRKSVGTQMQHKTPPQTTQTPPRATSPPAQCPSEDKPKLERNESGSSCSAGSKSGSYIGNSEDPPKSGLGLLSPRQRRVENPVWLAPELMGKHEDDRLLISKAADVYSYGVILWELVTRENFFGSLRFMSQIEDAVLAGERPAIPTHCPALFADLIRECWQADAASRPPLHEILFRLDRICAATDAASEGGNQMRGGTRAPGGQQQVERITKSKKSKKQLLDAPRAKLAGKSGRSSPHADSTIRD